MKKKKILATLLIASSAFLGTGYAWWTDGLEVKGIVSTGELKVVGVEAKITTIGKREQTDDMEEDTTSGVEGFSYVISDLYPYKFYKFTARFENQGSIPAKVAEIEIRKSVNTDFPNEESVFKHLQVTGTVKVVDLQGNQVIGNEHEGKYKYSIEKKDKVTIDNLEEQLRKNILGWQLEKTESILFEDFKVQLVNVGYDKKDKRNKFEGSKVKFDLEMSFNQHNQ